MALGRLGLGVLVLTVAAWAQEGGATGGGGGATGGGATGGGTTGGGGTVGGGTTGGGNTGGSRGSIPSTQQSPSNTQIQQPIFVSGRVTLDDGSAPPTQTVIERVCQNRVIREGYVDSKGYFSFQLGQNMGIFADASTDSGNFPGNDPFGRSMGAPGQSNTPSEMQLSSCELRATLAGYRSDSMPMFNIRALNRNDIGVIILHYFGNVQGLTTSATSALAPKEAKKSLERALKAIEKNDPDTAQKELLKAVELHPRYAEAWFHLGKVYERREHKDEALNAYKKSIAADGNFINPYERLYLMAYAQSQWDDVITHTEKVMHLNPFDFPGAYYVNAVANYQLKNYDAAEKSAREASKLKGKQTEPRSYYVLGLTLAQKGDFSAASESLKTFLKAAPAGTNLEQAQKILADVDRLASQKTVGAEKQ